MGPTRAFLMLVVVLLPLALPAQQAAPAPAAHENLNAVVWVQTSAEFEGNARQTYAAASAALQQALEDRNWTAALEQTGAFQDLRPAVILDLDETVLDNSAFQARGVRDRTAFTNELWTKWVAEAAAGGVPGALKFLATAHAAGVSIFYVTNRTCQASDPQDPTVRVLRKLNAPLFAERLLCKGESSDKSPRRLAVARSHRVLLLIGDDLGDFMTVPQDQATVAGRQAAIRPYEDYWGERWFVLPNPTYGSWERAVGGDVKGKVNALRF